MLERVGDNACQNSRRCLCLVMLLFVDFPLGIALCLEAFEGDCWRIRSLSCAEMLVDERKALGGRQIDRVE